MSHLLLPFLAICSSDHAGRMPGARTQSKLPIEIVAGNRQTSSHVCTQPQTHAFRSGFKPGTNVGAGCSCHPTGCDHHRSTRVPLHPVWPRPVARLVRTNQPSTSDSRIGRSPTTHETSELVEPAGSDAPNKCLRRSETPIYPDEDGEIDTDSSPECRPHDERNRSSGALGAYNPAHAKGGFSTFASSSRGFPRAARFSLALEFPLVVFCRFGDGAGR